MDNTFSLSGVHGINRYLARKLKDTLGMDPVKTGGITPLVPVQQRPQLNKYPEPFLVYNWVTQDQGPDWYFHRDTIIYSIFSEEEKEVRTILNYMRYLFESHDESAQRVNYFLSQQPNSATFNKEMYDRFNYKVIKVAAESAGAEPSETEDGRQEASLIINTIYTVDYPTTYL